MLDFQNQECSLTLREGVEHYRAYLKKNGKKVLDDQEDSLTILSHDATHVIYGLDTSLEEEQMLNFWTLFGTTYTWKEIMAYNGIKILTPEERNVKKIQWSGSILE